MGKIKDLTGQKFERWTVIEIVGINRNHKVVWLCECGCENKTRKEVIGSNLIRGDSKSCGCLKSDGKHGMASTRIYSIYRGMKYRCLNANDVNYRNYGARGIIVCEEWLDANNGFNNFLDWSMKNGYTDVLTIDRKNVNGNYEPNNCHWSTMKEQQNNKRNNILLTFGNETKTVQQWADSSGVTANAIYGRIKCGWENENLLNKAKEADRKSGVEGITWHKQHQSWQVQNLKKKIKKYVGHFENLKDAIKALESEVENEKDMH